MSARSVITICFFSFVALVFASGAAGTKGCACPKSGQLVSPPVINYFSANRDNINPSEPVQISWSVFDADTVWIEGPGIPKRSVNNKFGSMGVNPMVTSTYTLSATRSDPTVPIVEQSITIHVKTSQFSPPKGTTSGTGECDGH